MTDRVEVSKLVGYVVTGEPSTAQVSKLVAYIVLEPDASEVDDSNRQGHVYSQIIERD